MKGIKLLGRALSGFDKSLRQLDQAVKHIQRHKADNDVALEREHGRVHRLMAAAEDWYRRTSDYLNERRDRASNQHQATYSALDHHEQRATRIHAKLSELLQ